MNLPRNCPECGAIYDAEAVLCVRCGVDLKTGRRHRQTVHSSENDPPAEPPEPTPGAGAYLWQFIRDYFPGFFRPMLLLVSLLVGALGMVILAMGIGITALFGTVFTGVAICGVGFVLYLQGVAWIQGGDYSLLPDQMTDFDSNDWMIFILLWGAPLPLLIFVMQTLVEKTPG